MSTDAIDMYDRQKMNWFTTVVLVLLHIGAIAALFMFSWSRPGRRRLLALGGHRARHQHGLPPAAHAPVLQGAAWALEYFLAVCGTLTLEGGPIFWVATHRIHHQHSDQPGDPHSPRDGAFWAHMGWILFGEANHNSTRQDGEVRARPGQGPVLRLAEQLSLGAAGGARRCCCSRSAACRWCCGAIFLRVVVGLHATWLVNSATHMWGARRFATRDDSRNNWWVALLTFGEGWHNNHHAHPDLGASRPGLVRVRSLLDRRSSCCRLLGLAKAVQRRQGQQPA